MKRTVVLCVTALIAIGFLCSCDNKDGSVSNINPVSENETSSSAVFSMKELPAGVLIWEEYDFPFPKPPADSFEINREYANALVCWGITEVEREAFFMQLLSDGWRRITDESPFHSLFLRGNEYLSIYAEGVHGSGVYVFGYDAGYSGENRSGSIPHSEAFGYICASYDEYQSNQNTYDRDSVITAIREVGIKDLFEKTGMQLFQAFGNRGEISLFLVIEKTACMVPSVFGVVDRIPVYVMDIDQDGKYEVIISHNEGSGVSRFAVSAYKFGHPHFFNKKTIYIAYSNIWTEGKPCLTLEQNENGSVHLRRFSYDNKDFILNDDYGRLIVNRHTIVPERYDLFEKNFLWEKKIY